MTVNKNKMSNAGISWNKSIVMEGKLLIVTAIINTLILRNYITETQTARTSHAHFIGIPMV